MRSRISRRHLWPAILAGLLYVTLSFANGEEWPITFTTISITSSDYTVTDRSGPLNDCQPELFDPMKNWFRKVEPKGLVGVNSTFPDIYEIKGEDESVSMTIDSGSKQGGSKTVLPEPYSITKYNFGCASESSQVFEFRKNGRRHALYTHINQASFSPDRKRFVLFNYIKTPKGNWQEIRRIIDIETKKFSNLPITHTSYIADITNDKIVTYGSPTISATGIDSQQRMVNIWDHEGNLIRSLSAPILTTTANAYSSDDGIGLLPNEPTTFYHFTRTGENVCTLRLQDINRPEGRRSIRITVPGPASEPAAVGALVQIELEALQLKGGTMKYRVAARGRGDVSGDWGAWQVAE